MSHRTSGLISPVVLCLYCMKRNLQQRQTDVDLVAHVKQREVEDETWGKQEVRFVGGDT